MALALGELKIAYDLAVEADNEEKWRQLSQAATQKSELILAGECLGRAHDYGGLMLLATSAGSAHLLDKLGQQSTASGQNNVAFMAHLLLGNVDQCLEVLISTGRLPEAAFFARTYAPSHVPRVVALWRESTTTGRQNGQKVICCLRSNPFTSMFYRILAKAWPIHRVMRICFPDSRTVSRPNNIFVNSQKYQYRPLLTFMHRRIRNVMC